MPRLGSIVLGPTFRLTPLIALAGLLATAIACAAEPAPPTATPTPVPDLRAVGEDESGAFRLVFELPRDTWQDGEEIDGEASLLLEDGDSADISGSGSGIVFRFVEVDGPRRVDPVWTDDCQPRTIAADDPLRSQITKSGAHDDDFSRDFLSDPLVRLPPGVWEISAMFEFFEGPGCDGAMHRLEATVRILVEQ
jgi:hypothetical protein